MTLTLTGCFPDREHQSLSKSNIRNNQTEEKFKDEQTTYGAHSENSAYPWRHLGDLAWTRLQPSAKISCLLLYFVNIVKRQAGSIGLGSIIVIVRARSVAF